MNWGVRLQNKKSRRVQQNPSHVWVNRGLILMNDDSISALELTETTFHRILSSKDSGTH